MGTVNEIMVGHRASEILVYHLRVCEQNRSYRSLAAFASKRKDFLSKYAHLTISNLLADSFVRDAY